MKNTFLFLFIIVIGVKSHSQEINFSNELLDSTIVNLKNKWKIPGMSVAIAKEGRLVYAKGFGYADTLKKEPVTTKSIFRIASCSKTITALGVMKLVEDKKLNLNDTVFGKNGILNDSLYQNITDEKVYAITLKNLLQHTVGWPDLDIIGDNDASYALNLPTPAGTEANIKYMLLQKLEFETSKEYRYSNFNYLFLGEIIQNISGKTYEEFIQTKIFKPLGIDNTFPSKSKLEGRLQNEVIYYDYRGETSTSAFDTTAIVPMSYSYNMKPTLPEGGWVSSPIDLLKIVLAFDGLDNRAHLLKKETIEIMATPPKKIDTKYGMGMRVLKDMKYHTGALTWGTFALWLKTEDNVSLALICNTLPNAGESDEEKMESIREFYKDVFVNFLGEIKKIKNYPETNLFGK